LESVVGLLLPKIGVQQIHEQLIIAGMPNIHVASLGGDQVLISSPIKGFLKESLLERSDWWLSWFQGFTRWSEDLPQPGQNVWLCVFGIPVHLWCNNVFVLVGSRFGVVLEMEVTDQTYEFARVRVRTPDVSPVAASVTVVAGGRRFEVYVREDFPSEGFKCHYFLANGASEEADGFSAGEDGCSNQAC